MYAIVLRHHYRRLGLKLLQLAMILTFYLASQRCWYETSVFTVSSEGPEALFVKKKKQKKNHVSFMIDIQFLFIKARTARSVHD